MLWSEVKRWCKENGFEAKKLEGSYSWFKLDNPECCGTVSSVSKLAKAIYNQVTNNKFLSHQESYKNDPRF